MLKRAGSRQNEHVRARLIFLIPGAYMGNTKEYKRKHERLNAPFIIKILTYNYEKLDSEYCAAATGINISPGGLSFKYPKVISKGDHLRVLIQDIKGLNKEEIIAHVKILWTETKDILSKRFGGKFVKLAPDKKYKLMKTIRKNGGLK